MKTQEWWENPFIVLPAIFAGILLVVVLIAKLILPAIAVAVDIVKAGLVGAVASGLVAAWLVPVATVSVTVVGVITSVSVLVYAAERIKKHKYQSALGVLAIFAAFVVDVSKEFNPFRLPQAEIGKAIFAAITSALFFVGGLLWRRAGLLQRFLATVLFLISPFWILAYGYSQSPKRNVLEFLGSIDKSTAIAVVVLIAILLATAALARVLPEQD